jgi:Mn-containing catalase
VQTNELRDFLVGFAAERLALIERQEAGARVVSHYDFNNTYQYVISREETHLQWLGQALVELNEPLPKASSVLPVPALPKLGKKVEPSAFRPVLSDDASLLDKFSERWRSRVDGLTHARHRTMLQVVMGETREHQRLFEQAAAGNEDVLGRRTGGVARVGAVLPDRWQE